jgi:hypothetical protein
MAHYFKQSVRSAMLDHYLGGKVFPPPAGFYLGAFLVLPTDEDLGTGYTEVSGVGYARVASPNDATNWPDAVAAVKRNGVAIAFPGAGGAWGTIIGVGLFLTSTGGTPEFWADCDPVVIGADKTLYLEAAQLPVTLA